MTTLSRQVLVERVLTLWLQESRDIIEQSEGRRP